MTRRARQALLARIHEGPPHQQRNADKYRLVNCPLSATEIGAHVANGGKLIGVSSVGLRLGDIVQFPTVEADGACLLVRVVRQSNYDEWLREHITPPNPDSTREGAIRGALRFYEVETLD